MTTSHKHIVQSDYFSMKTNNNTRHKMKLQAAKVQKICYKITLLNSTM